MVRTVANMSVHENIYSNNIDIWCTQRQLSENICSEDDLRSAISEHLSKISCLSGSPRIFEHLKNGIIADFKRIFSLKRSPRIFGSLFCG